MSVDNDAWRRKHYGPPCNGARLTTVRTFGRRQTVAKGSQRAFKRLNRIFRTYHPAYHRKIKKSADVGTYNCRLVTGGSYYSSHAFALANDLRWQSNGYGDTTPEVEREAPKAIRQWKNEGQIYGGDYRTPDAMHFGVGTTPRQNNRRYTATGRCKGWYRRKLKREGKWVKR